MGCLPSSPVEEVALNDFSKFPVYGSNDIMKKKAHGTSETPVQSNLRWNCSSQKADKICNFNRHLAEPSGSAERNKNFKAEIKKAKKNKTTVKFYDSNTGKLVFEAPKYRTHEEFLIESNLHGWPSFRDNEVNWDYVRCLKNGECVSIDGTHLGHNLPDRTGNRYCINLVSVAGNPLSEEAPAAAAAAATTTSTTTTTTN